MISIPELVRRLFEARSQTEQPIKERAIALPLGVYADDSVGPAWPGALYEPAQAWTKMVDRGPPQTQDEVAETARDSLWLAASAAMPSVANSLAKATVYGRRLPYQNSPEHAIMARKGEAGYRLPDMPQREFHLDYRRAPEGPEGSPLKRDIEGRELVAQFVAGRRRSGGADEPIAERDLDRVAALLGSTVSTVPRRDLPKVKGKHAVGAFDPNTKAIRVADDLDPEDTAIALAHEVGHAIDHKIWRGMPLDDVERASRSLYHGQATNKWDEPMRRWTSPELEGYPKSQVRGELVAEGIRAYMTNPNAFKAKYPNLAKRIRETFNDNPSSKSVIQFNVNPASAAVVNPSLFDDDELKRLLADALGGGR